MKTTLFNKTHFLTYLRCKEKFRRDLAGDAPEEGLGEELFKKYGDDVGQAARSLFPEGNLINQSKKLDEQVKETSNHLKSSKENTLFEASFIYERFVAKSDVLVLSEDGTFTLNEVKATTSIEKEHLFDIAFQVFVIERATQRKVSKCNLIILNSDYVLGEKLDLHQLFKIEDVSGDILRKDSLYFESVVKFSHENFSSHSEFQVGTHCNSPQVCPYKKECFSEDNTILNLRRSQKKWSFFNLGIKKLYQVVDDESLSTYQHLQALSEKTDTTIIHRSGLNEFLKSIKGEVAFLDFESIALPIPLWQGVEVYQHIVFQASIHISNGSTELPIHIEFLHSEISDPSESLIRFLINILEDIDTIVVYFEAFEKGRLRELQKRFPEYHSMLERIISKIIDLEKVFSKALIVSHRFNGSTSIKKVLGVICPEMATSYEDLEGVKNGQTASATYYLFLKKELTQKVQKKVFKQLSEYCELDTLSLWFVLEKLKILAKE